MPSHPRFPGLTIVLTWLIPAVAGAATIDNPALLPDGDGGADDRFGTALALDDDTLVVGVSRDSPNGGGSGSAYVFTRVAGVWTVQQRLVPADGATGDQFGYSVALRGDHLVVGAPNSGSSDEGAAYVYVRNAGTFTPEQKLTVPPITPPRNFGWSVALGPDVLWVGSPSHRITGNFQGSATQFRRDQNGVWQEGPTFGPFDGNGGETFGIAMAYADGNLIVGERGEDVGNQGFAGAAIGYRYDGVLTQLNVFSAPGVQSFDQFGAAIAVDGDRAVIGAPSNLRPGYAQVFRLIGAEWIAEGQPLSLGSTGFGAAVAIDGLRIAVGGPGDSGLVQLYERINGQWTAGPQLAPPDLLSGDAFGSAVTFDSSEVMVGVPGRDVPGGAVDVGEARTFFEPGDGLFQNGFE